ncbi:hypothetical protein COCC4DRAFT_57317 [Bipolaris maydis ATCC 48331]|uniref:superoxide dismutase n=2 Tax=Cochliobolus heterostrophus TaxID=5016 RepID=N4XJ47_COCH4|nr:uncharacterized protein COCC4DRAFT_57317 [Bipolaris maydis ATCC 48331]KAH7559471.1 hypothetical protein BM1_04408 [Bipolaris maydis]ENI08578.1 hypothetical protein COCC4DRAFT_57317 [Bipolaris maydis ATCC 48331]KAJ5027183.1 superoxide dismutase [Bipolaris maydis]KAJ5059046.1 cytosolic Cu/Zn superoxide dismutase [Bipolaris maydis]KAJ6202631.1 cytosolic Cu/Zn superoxide dismutase [Bipolaris maydis]
MLVSVISILAAASAVTAQSTNAPVVTDNPIGATYVATLPQKAGSSLSGTIEGTTGADGKGVKFSVHFAGLPATGGPFMYHIHAKPVPADGNCTATGGHLDPYHYGETMPCNASAPETCQTGDLSGKYGNFSTQEFSAEYTDLYSATLPSNPAFFGSLSFVLHFANKTRIACANFEKVADGVSTEPPKSEDCSTSTMASTGYSIPTGAAGYNGTVPAPTAGKPTFPSAPSATSSSPLEFPGAAPKTVGGVGALFAAAAAAIFAL